MEEDAKGKGRCGLKLRFIAIQFHTSDTDCHCSQSLWTSVPTRPVGITVIPRGSADRHYSEYRPAGIWSKRVSENLHSLVYGTIGPRDVGD